MQKVSFCLAFTQSIWYNEIIEWGYASFSDSHCVRIKRYLCVSVVSYIGSVRIGPQNNNSEIVLKIETINTHASPPICPIPEAHFPRVSALSLAILPGVQLSRLDTGNMIRRNASYRIGRYAIRNGQAKTVDRRGYFTHAITSARRPFDNASGKS